MPAGRPQHARDRSRIRQAADNAFTRDPGKHARTRECSRVTENLSEPNARMFVHKGA
jgi:hypothetical protein